MNPVLQLLHKRMNNEPQSNISEDWDFRSVCHILNPCVTDAEINIKAHIESFRQLVWTIRETQTIRESFQLNQVCLPYEVSYEVHSLDVEWRRSSLHYIILGLYKLREIFSIIWNDPKLVDKLNEFALFDDEWCTVANMYQFLVKLAVVNKSSSSPSYAKVSIQHLMIDCLESHWKDGIEKKGLNSAVSASLKSATECIKKNRKVQATSMESNQSNRTFVGSPHW